MRPSQTQPSLRIRRSGPVSRILSRRVRCADRNLLGSRVPLLSSSAAAPGAMPTAVRVGMPLPARGVACPLLFERACKTPRHQGTAPTQWHTRRQVVDPDSGPYGGDHSPGPAVADWLMHPTRRLVSSRADSSPPAWACWRWGLPCRACRQPRGALLPHLFTLACNDGARVVIHRRSVFCGTFPRLTPGGR